MTKRKPANRLTVLDYADRYALEHDITPSTVEQLQITCRQLNRVAGRQVRVDELNDELANTYLTWLQDNGRKPPTVRSKRRSLMTLWRAAFEDDLVRVFPRRVKVIRIPEWIPTAWSSEQVDALLAACDSGKWRVRNDSLIPGTLLDRRLYFRSFILAAWDTALRLSDLLNLERSSINPEGMIWLVQHKTGYSHRVQLRPETIEAIDATFPPERKLIWPLWTKHRGAWFKMFHKLVRSAGLTGSSKWIRRASATAVEIAQPGAAMRHLGHRTHGLAYKHYVDPRLLQHVCTMPPALSSAGRQPQC